MYVSTVPFQRSSTGVALALMLAAAGCEDTVVPAVESASLAPEGDGDGRRSARNDRCLYSLLYEVEGELFHFKGGSTQLIDGTTQGGSGGGGGLAAEPGLGFSEQLDGYNGFARLLWDGQVVDELIIDRAFLQAGEPKVLAYDTPAGKRFEFHLYTRPDCNEPWVTPSDLTREEVEAREQ
jgi:hypothetical protein